MNLWFITPYWLCRKTFRMLEVLKYEVRKMETVSNSSAHVKGQHQHIKSIFEMYYKGLAKQDYQWDTQLFHSFISPFIHIYKAWAVLSCCMVKIFCLLGIHYFLLLSSLFLLLKNVCNIFTNTRKQHPQKFLRSNQ